MHLLFIIHTPIVYCPSRVLIEHVLWRSNLGPKHHVINIKATLSICRQCCCLLDLRFSLRPCVSSSLSFVKRGVCPIICLFKIYSKKLPFLFSKISFGNEWQCFMLYLVLSFFDTVRCLTFYMSCCYVCF